MVHCYQILRLKYLLYCQVFCVEMRRLQDRWISIWALVFITKQAITCSKLKIETLQQGVKYVQS